MMIDNYRLSCCGRLLAVACLSRLLEGIFHGFLACAGALLDASQKFVVLAFDKLEIIIGQGGPLFFEFALDDVPVAFDFKFGHIIVLVM